MWGSSGEILYLLRLTHIFFLASNLWLSSRIWVSEDSYILYRIDMDIIFMHKDNALPVLCYHSSGDRGRGKSKSAIGWPQRSSHDFPRSQSSVGKNKYLRRLRRSGLPERISQTLFRSKKGGLFLGAVVLACADANTAEEVEYMKHWEKRRDRF